MHLDPTYFPAVLGCVGGALPDVLRLIAGRYGDMPSYFRTPYFWISLVMLVALGGGAAYFVAYLSPGTEMATIGQSINYLAIGYSAPSVLSRLLSDPRLPSDLAAGGNARAVVHRSRSLRGWWSV